jgi:hypothetical protein
LSIVTVPNIIPDTSGQQFDCSTKTHEIIVFILWCFAVKLLYMLQQHTNNIFTAVVIVNRLQLNATNVWFSKNHYRTLSLATFYYRIVADGFNGNTRWQQWNHLKMLTGQQFISSLCMHRISVVHLKQTVVNNEWV